ncbi:hypothetical protein HBI56_138090 [Parastagonospora nodorum]|nr:hypothetical protein HBH53_120030 [Parastagonospora nodorum]KAH3970589.1 hypothetical protein HBH51_116410 [Parastagonospora nodorum]KAH3996357.1 hypothetical protein HBI10_157810 [Parastagonospora nodorum]KAH4018939.1 hypothetical protein HBI13_128260 [Parastagonospora nodorum]KAH4070493.1 hypothetical protein HBH50_084520 [Parastagonospora nodorum]
MMFRHSEQRRTLSLYHNLYLDRINTVSTSCAQSPKPYCIYLAAYIRGIPETNPDPRSYLDTHIMTRSVMIATHIATLYWFFGTTALAQSSSASFAYPRTTTPLLTINFVDTIVVEWTSNFQEACLWLFCGNDRWANIRVATSGNTSFSPSIDIKVPRDWTQAYNCHFDLNYRDSYKSAVNGPIFNITSIASQQTTTYALQSTTALSPSDASRSIATSTTGSNSVNGQPSATNAPSISMTIDGTSQPTASQTDSEALSKSKEGLPMGEKVGISIGAIAGSIALLALGFMVWRNKRKVDALNSQLSGAQDAGYGFSQNTDALLPVWNTGTFKQTVAMELEPEPYRAPQELEGSNVVISKP